MGQGISDLRAISRPGLPRAGGAATAERARVAVPTPPSRWRTRVLVPMVVVLATAGVLGFAARDVFRPAVGVFVTPAVPKAATVETGGEPAMENGVDGTLGGVGGDDRLGPVLVQAPGWVEPSPYAVNVPALAEGVVEAVLVLEGERVEAGQVVARMIDRDAELRKLAAESAVAQRVTDVEVAKAQLASARADVEVENAAVADLRDDVDRKRELLNAGGVGIGEFRRLEFRLLGAEAKVVASQRDADEADAQVKQTEAAVAAARVELDEAVLRVERMQIRTVTAGVVLSRLVEPGSRISMGNQSGEGPMSGVVLRTYDPEKLQVRVDVPLADAAKVGVGTRAQLTTEALPDVVFEGTVRRIMHEANIQRNTVQFKVDLAAPSPVLKPEMLMRVKFYGAGGARAAGDPSGNADGAADGSGLELLVPEGAVVQREAGGSMVWVVDVSKGSAVAVQRSVETRDAGMEGFVAAVSGVRLTDRLILDPPSTLREGVRVRVLGERTPSFPTN